MSDDDEKAAKPGQKSGKLTNEATPHFGLSASEVKELKEAFAYPFDEPVTAFLTRARIISASCLGVTHRHVRADPTGRFQDGHRIRTSDIRSAFQVGPFWCLRTVSGSFYVIATFNQDDGKASLDAFLQLCGGGINPSPPVLH